MNECATWYVRWTVGDVKTQIPIMFVICTHKKLSHNNPSHKSHTHKNYSYRLRDTCHTPQKNWDDNAEDDDDDEQNKTNEKNSAHRLRLNNKP